MEGHCLSSVLVLRGRGSRVRGRVNWVEIRERSSLPWNDLQLSPYRSSLYTVIPFCVNATRRVSFPATPGLGGRGQVYSVTRNFLLSQGIGVGGVQGRFFIEFQEPPNLGWCLLMIFCVINTNNFVPVTNLLAGLTR